MMWISPDICRGIFPAATPAPHQPHAFAESDSGWHAEFIPVIPVKDDNVRGEKKKKEIMSTSITLPQRCRQGLSPHYANKLSTNSVTDVP